LGGGFFTSFFNLLYSLILRQGEESKLCWIPSKKGLFDVRSYYSVLVPHDSTHFPWRNIWRNKTHLRVLFFAWLATWEKILIMDNLRKRHVIVVDWCCMCKKSGELVDFLLLHCEMASVLWNTTFSLTGLAWVMSSRVVDLFKVESGSRVVDLFAC
jgi:hypothetical protein